MMKKTADTDSVSPRRFGVESSQTRHALLDAAELNAVIGRFLDQLEPPGAATP